MKLWWRAQFPHYRRHLEPILDLATQLGVDTVEGDGPNMIVAGVPDVDRTRNTDRLILVEHGAGQTYRHGNKVVDPSGLPATGDRVTLYLASTPAIAEHMRSKFPNATIRVVGSPAVERLYWGRQVRHRPTPDRITFAVHWASPLGIPEAGTSWPWSMRILRSLIDAYGDRVLAHAHPRIAYRVKRDLRRARVDVEFEDDWDTAALKTKTLVCDNSSIIWEADAVGINLALIDPPNWNADADHGLRWGPEAAYLPRITSNDVSAITAARPAYAAVYGELTGSTRKAVDAITEHVAS